MLPLTLQVLLLVLNVTGFVEAPPVALKLPAAPPKVSVGAAPKLMVWLPLSTVMVCVTGFAAL